MIICFEGTPGSGKTYDAIRKIVSNLKLGRTVYTNIDGIDDSNNRQSIQSYTGLDDYEMSTKLIFVPINEIYEFYKTAKNNSVFVIDEVHKFFSNREWQAVHNKAFASWASEHRKKGIEIVLVTQNIEKVDSHVRGLVEWVYRYKKLNMFGSLIKNSYKVDSYNDNDSTGRPIDTRTYRYDSRVFRLYKSYVSDDIQELGIMKHANVLRHPVFYLIPVVVILSIFLFSKSSIVTGDFAGSKKLVQSKPQPAAVVDNKTVSGKTAQNDNKTVFTDVAQNNYPPAADLPVYTPGTNPDLQPRPFPASGFQIQETKTVNNANLRQFAYVNDNCELIGELQFKANGIAKTQNQYFCDGIKVVFEDGRFISRSANMPVRSQKPHIQAIQPIQPSIPALLVSGQPNVQ